MKLKNALAVFVSFFAVGFASAQDLGPQIRKLEDGVYVYVGKNFNSNCGVVLTREGVVLIESDTAVWLPKERVLFSAAGIIVNQINNLRPIVSIPDVLAAAKTMKSLDPLHVVPGHGMPGTVKIFADSEKYYALLLDRVGRPAREGKSLDQIKKEVRMPEYEHWAAQERLPSNVEAAYRAVKGG